jgi:hypothetical protein
MNDASPASDIPRARTGPVKPGPWRIADIVDGRKLRIQLTAAALDNGSDPIAQRKRALDLIHAALFRGRPWTPGLDLPVRIDPTLAEQAIRVSAGTVKSRTLGAMFGPITIDKV